MAVHSPRSPAPHTHTHNFFSRSSCPPPQTIYHPASSSHPHTSPSPPHSPSSSSSSSSSSSCSYSSHPIIASPKPILFHPQPMPAPSTSTSTSASVFGRRPKICKKPSSSNQDKRANVQHSLEMKVERAKGFQAFFVPLARGLPPAPPSSPVLNASSNPTPTPGLNLSLSTPLPPDSKLHTKSDPFGQYKGKQQWVEDVCLGDPEAMDLDSD